MKITLLTLEIDICYTFIQFHVNESHLNTMFSLSLNLNNVNWYVLNPYYQLWDFMMQNPGPKITNVYVRWPKKGTAVDESFNGNDAPDPKSESQK